LGFSSLTKGEIKLEDFDYKAWKLQPTKYNYNFLAAKILEEFRATLLSLKNKFKNLKISQLSDCAFIYSQNKYELLQGVHFFMWEIIQKKCILCRGGIAHGTIIESTKNGSLGGFIVGEAVTNAVKNESMLKGPRISMDISFAYDFWNYTKGTVLEKYSSNLLNHVHSLINGDDVDEYRWYLFDDTVFNKQNLSEKDRIQMTKERLKLGCIICYHSRFSWNGKSKEGMRQLNIGMEAINANNLLNVDHNLSLKEVATEREKINGKKTIKNIIKGVQYKAK